MAAKSFASRLRGSRRFLSGFVAGAVVGAAGAGLTALQFLRSQGAEAALAAREPEGESVGLLSLPRPRCQARNPTSGVNGSCSSSTRGCLPSPLPWLRAFLASVLGLLAPRPV